MIELWKWRVLYRSTSLVKRKCYWLNEKSGRSEVLCKQGAKFRRKHLRQRPFFNKVASFFKKETLAQVFSVNFVKFLRTPFSIEHLLWLLLKWLFFPMSSALNFRKAMTLNCSSFVNCSCKSLILQNILKCAERTDHFFKNKYYPRILKINTIPAFWEAKSIIILTSCGCFLYETTPEIWVLRNF